MAEFPTSSADAEFLPGKQFAVTADLVRCQQLAFCVNADRVCRLFHAHIPLTPFPKPNLPIADDPATIHASALPRMGVTRHVEVTGLRRVLSRSFYRRAIIWMASRRQRERYAMQ